MTDEKAIETRGPMRKADLAEASLIANGEHIGTILALEQIELALNKVLPLTLECYIHYFKVHFHGVKRHECTSGRCHRLRALAGRSIGKP